MAGNQGVGELVKVVAHPIVPPVCGTDDGTGVGDATAEDDLGACLEGGGDAETSEVGLCGDGSVGAGPGGESFGGVDVFEVGDALLKGRLDRREDRVSRDPRYL